MSAEHEEVAVEVLHIDLEVGHALCTVYEYVGAMGMCHLCHALHGVDRAEHIAHVCHADQSGAGCEQAFVGFEIKAALIVHGDDFDDNACTVAQELPGHDIAMVLHDGEYHFVAFMEECLAVRGCHEIEAFCGATGEDYFGCASGIDKLAYRFASCLMEVGGLL